MENTVTTIALAILTHPFVWIFVALTVAMVLIQSLVHRESNAREVPQGVWETFGMDTLPPPLRTVLTLLWLMFFIAFLCGAAFSLFETVKATFALARPAPTPFQSLFGTAKTDFRFYLLTLAAMTAGVSAIVALPFTLIRTKNSTASTRAEEQGLVTDRLNKAVEGLGAQKEVNRLGRTISLNDGAQTEFEWKDEPITLPQDETRIKFGVWTNTALTQPNLEVRIGAIYALERIAKENKGYHVQVMEILCAYIRENAPASSAVDWPELEMRDSEETGPLEPDFKARAWAFREASHALTGQVKPRSDIQTALTVIGRRTPKQRQWEAEAGNGAQGDAFVFDAPCPEYDEHAPLGADWARFETQLDAWSEGLDAYKGYRVDLRGTNLQGTDMAGMNFTGARFNEARIDGASLNMARMQGASFSGASIQGAIALEARLQGAFLFEARIQGAKLYAASMQGAEFMRGKIQGSGFLSANMHGANFIKASMQIAKLERAMLHGATLGLAKMQATELTEARLQGAVLTRASMQEARILWADLSGARMQGANLSGVSIHCAALRNFDCSQIPDIERKISGCFGDASVILPATWDRPSHWPKYEMRHFEFHTNWLRWRKDPEGYDPPDPPAPADDAG